MLVHLSIKDLAIIESTELDLTAGLNVITGETGAGKSIVVGALNLVLGGRAKSTAIRLGSDQAEVQALFRVHPSGEIADRLRTLELLEGSGTETVELVVRRIISRNGRGRVWLNGVLINVSTLARLTRGLVDISSQREHATLLDVNAHLGLLDRFGDLARVRTAYTRTWEQLSKAKRDLSELCSQDAERLQREDYLRFQLTELDELAPAPGEEETLRTERERLVHADRLVSGSRAIEGQLVNHNGCVQEMLVAAGGQLEGMQRIDETLAPLAQRLEEARIEIADIAYEVRSYGDQIEIDPRRLEVVEERLHGLFKLGKKHGLDTAGLVDKAAALREELEALESLDLAMADAERAADTYQEVAMEAARALSKARQEAAETLTKQVEDQLVDLAMGDARVRFAIEAREALGPHGLDGGQLLIQTNTGEGYKPLTEVASGGELSRVLLALKSVLAKAHDVYVGVFDEVDAGVGGAVADVVGRKLAELARHRQVVAITHLPQIASQANHHLSVSKHTEAGRTRTSVSALSESERIQEVARMLGGVEVTEKTRAHAAELLTRSFAP